MPQTRTIVVVTGSRAEFGLLLPVMRAIMEQDGLLLRTVMTGTHLITQTWRDITEAGIAIDAKAPMQVKGEVGRAADVASLGRGIIAIGEALAGIHPRPRIVVVLGDRIEALAGAMAASIGGLHLAHIHGGDRAEGVADEAIRHAISKFAHLHFAATATSRKRLIRMGEDPDLVFNTGSPAADGLADIAPSGDGPELIVLQHPIGATEPEERRWLEQTLRATATLHRLVLAPNQDPGCAGSRAALLDAKVDVTDHLPRPQFLALLAGAKAIVGNSSAGLIEAAVLGVPAVNVGPRQAGREKPSNIVDCEYGVEAVSAALKKAMKLDLSAMRHPYGDGRAGRQIAELLASIDLAAVSQRKRNMY